MESFLSCNYEGEQKGANYEPCNGLMQSFERWAASNQGRGGRMNAEHKKRGVVANDS